MSILSITVIIVGILFVRAELLSALYEKEIREATQAYEAQQQELALLHREALAFEKESARRYLQCGR
ncbi:MAG: hypothetical protein IJZ37_00905 [Clostridia bacterium]|nr:hypothetical protein [Clostridia bacterium]MBQ8235225.1 hypothetical protein [Clostridia bacterium]MBQ8399159.1 hypothetical protein [Clostridia bacterium]